MTIHSDIETLRESNERLRLAFNQQFQFMAILSSEGRVLDVSDLPIQIQGGDREEYIGKLFWKIPTWENSPEWQEKIEKRVRQAVLQHEPLMKEDVFFAADGVARTALASYTSIRNEDNSVRYILVQALDITDSKKTEEELRIHESYLKEAQEVAHLGNWELDVLTNHITWSDEIYRIFGMTPSKAGLTFDAFRELVHPDDQDSIDELAEKLATERSAQFQYRLIRPNGQVRWVSGRGKTTFDESGTPVRVFGVLQDVTDQHALENQLRQAQKMESVGRLAGGVAHDFNNMLGVILGHVDMILAKTNPDHSSYSNLKEIKKAGKRSADLTRQLLAFARQQTITPKVIDLNETVSGITNMLQRLIGEDINLAWVPHEELWPVKIDPSQLDQILANLCVNARDAIADVGKVTIETANTAFDEVYCAQHVGFESGEYVMLAVSDDGCGMDSDTLNNVFEPFYTTKEQGKGTGLGLATIYGVVKQNKGFINVYSEPNHGTTFKIYLKRHLGMYVDQFAMEESSIQNARGDETILLAEDDLAILEMTTTMLELEGYTVLSTNSPAEAIRLASEHPNDIHLFLSDVVMPEMNGRDLSHKILSIYPQLKCLFMSGYTANVIAHRGVLDDGINFIQKPFSMSDLMSKVREVLDSGKKSVTI